MPSQTMTAWGSLLSKAAIDTFTNVPIRVGVILEGSEQSDVDIAANTIGIISGFEYDGSGWSRPSRILSSVGLGAYNNSLERYEIDGVANSITITAPINNFRIKQVIFILGGSPNPRDTTGYVIGISTIDLPSTMAIGETLDVQIPWNIRGRL